MLRNKVGATSYEQLRELEDQAAKGDARYRAAVLAGRRFSREP